MCSIKLICLKQSTKPILEKFCFLLTNYLLLLMIAREHEHNYS